MDVSGSDAPGVPVVVVTADALARWSPPAGWVRRDGFELPGRPWDLGSRRWVCVGVVASPAEARAALDAGSRGCGLAVAVDLPGEARLRFLEDLDRLRGDAEIGAAADAGPAARVGQLSELERRLLASVASGQTLSAAAQEAHVSRRTAHRAMARARAILDAPTTAAAASRWSADRAGHVDA